MIPDLISVREVARILGVRRRYIYTLVAKGRIPVVRVGYYIRFRPDEIRRWIETLSADAERGAGTVTPDA